MPGFAVGFVESSVSSPFAEGVDVDHFSPEKYFHRNYIPYVERRHIGDDEIYLVCVVGDGTTAGLLTDAYGKPVLVSRPTDENGLDLNSQYVVAAVEQKVVGQPVSVWAGRVEAQRCGFQDESQFSHFAMTAGIESWLAGGAVATLGWLVENPRVVWHVAAIEKAQSRESVCAFDLYIYASRLEGVNGTYKSDLFLQLNEWVREK